MRVTAKCRPRRNRCTDVRIRNLFCVTINECITQFLRRARSNKSITALAAANQRVMRSNEGYMELFGLIPL